VYIITSAQDTNAVFKHVSQLSFDSYLRDMSARFGMSPQTIEAAWRAHEKTSSHPGGAIAAAQFLPGPHMGAFQDVLLGRIHALFKWDAIPTSLSQKDAVSEKVVSLSHWVRHTLTESTTIALFGEALQQIEPNIVDALSQYDHASWKFTYQVPAMFSRDMLRAKDTVQNALYHYFELPASERTDACYMVHTLESEMRALDATSQDVSASMMLLYWVANTNAWKAAFWMIARILHDPNLKRRVEQELEPHISENLSPTQLQSRLDTLPLLNAIYYETLRTTASSISVRDVLEDTTISNLKLSKGSRLIVPYRQMLLDEEVFGPDAESFKPDRFLHNPELAKHPSFRPFGGGTTFCPGRFLAQNEATTVVALALSRFEIELENPGESLPGMDERKPCLGIMGLKEGVDISVRMKEKKSS
jgi:cytochrome P450